MAGSLVVMPDEKAVVASELSLALDGLRVANRLNGNRHLVHQQRAGSKGIIPVGTIGHGIDTLMRRAENWLIPWKGHG